MTKEKFRKDECTSPVDFADLESRAEYFIYFYKVCGVSKVVLSESIEKKDVIRVCNEVIDAITDFKRDFSMKDGSGA